jgi:hypothetical protein
MLFVDAKQYIYNFLNLFFKQKKGYFTDRIRYEYTYI